MRARFEQMAFKIELALPDLPPGNAVFRAWLVPIETYVPWNTAIAAVSIGKEAYNLICNMPVVVRRPYVWAGENLAHGTVVAQVLAEGDEIPYGRPYARVELEG